MPQSRAVGEGATAQHFHTFGNGHAADTLLPYEGTLPYGRDPAVDSRGLAAQHERAFVSLYDGVATFPRVIRAVPFGNADTFHGGAPPETCWGKDFERCGQADAF